MRVIAVVAALVFGAPLCAHADTIIQDRDTFLQALNGRALTIGIFDLSLNVNPDGTLGGSAMGWDVTGSWEWKDGLFCRQMDWSGYEVAFDCQVVEKVGEKLRFIADRGEGRAADFRLR